MGGHSAGDVASGLAINALAQHAATTLLPLEGDSAAPQVNVKHRRKFRLVLVKPPQGIALMQEEGVRRGHLVRHLPCALFGGGNGKGGW